jgi:hypothetical protein
MRLRIWIILFFLGFSSMTFSQTTEDKNTWIIKENATSLIDVFSFPTVQFSVEKKLTDNFSINTEIGYQLYDFRHTDTVFLSPRGFKLNFECRYYISKLFRSHLSNGIYIGLQGFYRQNQYTASISYCTSPDSIHMKNDEFGVKKSIIGLNLMLGYESSITNKLILDIYVGLGGMNRVIKNTDIQFNRKSGDFLEGTDLVPLFEKLNLSESSGGSVSFTFGLRIGIKL